MISNAKDTPLLSNPGTLPNVSEAILNWFRTVTFTRIVKTVVNYQLKETRTDSTYQGVRQPFTAQQLLLRPEGQRLWRWHMIHALPDLVLTVDEVINIGSVNYRVMEKLDFTEYGYVEYHAVEDFNP